MQNQIGILKWGSDFLLANGYSLPSAPEVVIETPWSNVVRYSTTTGNFYLKQTAPDVYIEAAIIQLLQQQFHANVADVIATNNALHCFIMRDSGVTLRTYLKTDFQVELLYKAIAQFAVMQRSVENDVQAFIELGVPDWRLDKWPALYEQLIHQKDLLLAAGVTEQELQILHDLRGTLAKQCQLLSQYNIPGTIVQPDCNTNNTLIDPKTKKMLSIDLGEIVITHPFMSLVNFLYQATIHEDVKEDDQAYAKMQNAYFLNWRDLRTTTELMEAYILTKKLYPIYGILGHLRLRNFVDPHEYQKYFTQKRTNKISENFKQYIENCK